MIIASTGGSQDLEYIYDLAFDVPATGQVEQFQLDDTHFSLEYFDDDEVNFYPIIRREAVNGKEHRIEFEAGRELTAIYGIPFTTPEQFVADWNGTNRPRLFIHGGHIHTADWRLVITSTPYYGTPGRNPRRVILFSEDHPLFGQLETYFTADPLINNLALQRVCDDYYYFLCWRGWPDQMDLFLKYAFPNPQQWPRVDAPDATRQFMRALTTVIPRVLHDPRLRVGHTIPGMPYRFYYDLRFIEDAQRAHRERWAGFLRSRAFIVTGHMDSWE